MKKSIGIAGSVILSLFFVSASAQEPTTPPPTTPSPTTTWDAKKNPTVDSINAKYKDMMVPARTPMTTEQIFPVLGKYESTVNTDAPSVTISMDAENKGIVWVEGLPQGKIKAMLRKSPAIYKIPVQKTEDGKDIAEGTLVFDKDAKTLNIVIGTPYNTVDPLAVFNTSTEVAAEETETTVKTKTAKGKTKVKTKVKPWKYSGTKVEVETAVTAPTPMNQ